MSNCPALSKLTNSIQYINTVYLNYYYSQKLITSLILLIAHLKNFRAIQNIFFIRLSNKIKSFNFKKAINQSDYRIIFKTTYHISVVSFLRQLN